MSEVQRKRDQEELSTAVLGMYEALYTWREEHAEASFDEIAAQVTPRRRELVGMMLERLARQAGTGQVAEGMVCEQCGQPMSYKGEAKRDVIHYLEGGTRLERAYYHCDRCAGGVFPPGRTTETGSA
jgi:hypothetical protein